MAIRLADVETAGSPFDGFLMSGQIWFDDWAKCPHEVCADYAPEAGGQEERPLSVWLLGTFLFWGPDKEFVGFSKDAVGPSLVQFGAQEGLPGEV